MMIACFRSLGLPARYVSGYLRTDDDGIGAHASHAWLSIYCPGFGWLDLDPTNDVIPGTGHVTLGWGRDYSDVPPLQGVALGGADQVDRGRGQRHPRGPCRRGGLASLFNQGPLLR